jgi:hypothetical protein
MKLNPDCIRDILLTVEEYCPFDRGLAIDRETLGKYPLLSKYDYGEVAYHVDQCKQSGLLNNVKMYIHGGYQIRGLTPAGHDFLANIASDTAWSKVKSKLQEIGSTSLQTLVSVAAKLIADGVLGG